MQFSNNRARIYSSFIFLLLILENETFGKPGFKLIIKKNNNHWDFFFLQKRLHLVHFKVGKNNLFWHPSSRNQRSVQKATHREASLLQGTEGTGHKEQIGAIWEKTTEFLTFSHIKLPPDWVLVKAFISYYECYK